MQAYRVGKILRGRLPSWEKTWFLLATRRHEKSQEGLGPGAEFAEISKQEHTRFKRSYFRTWILRLGLDLIPCDLTKENRLAAAIES